MKKIFISACLVPVFCILFILFNGDNKQVQNYTPNQAPPEVKPAAPRPGSLVEWVEFKPLNSLNDAAWGEVLTDIKNHLPESEIRQYQFPDKNTDAHESTHGIHSYLCNNKNPVGDRSYYWLYPGQNKAVKIKEPNFTIADIAKIVPDSLKKSRFQLYLVQQRRYWDKEPIYLWDEWVAYCNGAECGIELMNKKSYKPGKNDSSWGVLEFNVYATYVAIAQKKHDPNYDNKQLLEFLAWNLERGMNIYKAGQKLDDYNWDDDKYLQQLKTSAEASEFRKFLIDTYGAGWTNQVFGFTAQ